MSGIDGTANRKFGRETAFFIDDGPNTQAMYDISKYDFTKESNDPICAITADDHMLLVARASGNVMRFGLPSLSLDAKYFFKTRPNTMEINCDSSRVGVIDMDGILSFYDLDQGGAANRLEFQKSEVW
mmetsp:Transcript_312/g.288  ORF Transcript_312/g.288 Transcript_312/m.288 type:complete len:128 (+) Transcript_312:1411-1794(+)